MRSLWVDEEQFIMFKFHHHCLRHSLSTIFCILLPCLILRFDSISSTGIHEKELKFIHITKTGGGFLEDLALKYNVTWGRHFSRYGWQHGLLSMRKASIQKKYDWFAVVRNPYDRIISEFHCPYGGVGRYSYSVDEDYFNIFLMKHIITRNPTGDHYTEQYKYFDGVLVDVRAVHYEAMETEFNQLMREYDLPIVWERKVLSSEDSRYVAHKFHVRNMSKPLINLIKDVYREDFIRCTVFHDTLTVIDVSDLVYLLTAVECFSQFLCDHPQVQLFVKVYRCIRLVEYIKSGCMSRYYALPFAAPCTVIDAGSQRWEPTFLYAEKHSLSLLVGKLVDISVV